MKNIGKKENDGNQIIGDPTLIDTKIEFVGNHNILYCEKDITIKNSHLKFFGDNSIIYLSSNTHPYFLNVTLHHNCSFYMGKNNYINNRINVVISEEKNVFIGSGGLFSFDIWIRTADPHLIYDAKTHKRINNSQSVFIGDHVWIGQAAMLLKGTQVASGSILGAGSIVSGKVIPSNVVFGGNPAKQIRTDIFWEETCVHQWTKKQTNANNKMKTDRFIYKQSSGTYISFQTIDKQLSLAKTAKDRLQFFLNLDQNKNRFALSRESKTKIPKVRKILKKIKYKIKF